jgi:nucleoside-diphosphate-sugar epimerase
MDKLNIFGGSGFIGSNYAKLYPSGVKIIPRDVNESSRSGIDSLYLISTVHNYNVFKDVHLDIDTNLNKLMKVLPNVGGTFNFVSSWFVYGDGYTEKNPAKEDSRCEPKGFYSITKKAAEDLTISYCETFEKKYRILRLCNVVGGDSGFGKQKNALEFMVNNLVKGEPINVYNGDNYRNIMHVEDVCAAINLIIENGVTNEIYNIGAENSYRIIDIVNYVVKKTGSSSKISYIDAPKFHKIVQAENFFMDTSKLRKLGFVQKYNLYQTIDSILEKIKS